MNVKKAFEQKVYSLVLLLIRIERTPKKIILSTFDAFGLLISLALAMIIKNDDFSFLLNGSFYLFYASVAAPTIIFFHFSGLYKTLLKHASTDVISIVTKGSLASTLLAFMFAKQFKPEMHGNWSLIYLAFFFISVCGIKVILRGIFTRVNHRKSKNIAVFGAGTAGAQALRVLMESSEYNVKLIIDESPAIRGERMFGRKICNLEDSILLFKDLEITTVLLAVPSAGQADRQRILSKLIDHGVVVKTIPDLSRLIDGSAKVSEFRDIKIDDLLQRQPVKPNPTLLRDTIRGKVILVTGAGGTIGSEICRQIIPWKPKHLIILDHSENIIYNLEQELGDICSKMSITLTPVIHSVLNKNLLKKILTNLEVEIIYHAAAYKHVPLLEKNILQGFFNNVIGTETIANCAVEARVKNFILISTDKAVNPTSIMGASKMISEQICRDINSKQNNTKLSMVRFGNVLGSSGSVIPQFRKQIDRGGPVTITHPDITRYFMTIPEAAQLVIQAGGIANGGEVFVLDMGKPMRILDLAKKMIRLSGHQPFISNSGQSGDIEIKMIGLRPGEKLFEELSHDGAPARTKHDRILIAQETVMPSQAIKSIIDQIKDSFDEGNVDRLLKAVKKLVPSLNPNIGNW